MKICFFGLGSIGKRHLRNLIKIAEDFDLELEIHALRGANKALEQDIRDLINYEVYSETELSDDYDITFITNPTSLHYQTMKSMANRTKHMFIEKPIFHSIDCDMNHIMLREDGVYYVAAPLRFSDVVQALKKIVIEEQIYNVRAICSSYLPDWRPGVDYRSTYSAKNSEGGGVSIDLIHEWDYITYLFGFPMEMYYLAGQYSHLEIDSDDIAIYIARYETKLVELHLDYYGRTIRRQIEMFTSAGTIVGDLINKTISFTDGRKMLDFSAADTDIYVEEMKAFIQLVLKGTTSDNTNYAINVLKLATGGL